MKTFFGFFWHSAFMRWLLKIIDWEVLSKLGRSKFIQSFSIWLILVPLFAKIFSELPPEMIVKICDNKFTLVLQFPFKLSIFYFTSCAFFMSSLLYKFSCPPLIKDYKDVSTFLSRNGSISYLGTAIECLDTVQVKGYSDLYLDNKNPSTVDLANFYSDATYDLKQKNSISRLLLLIIYFFGFLGLLFIFIENTSVVLKELE